MNISGALFMGIALITLVAAWRVVVSQKMMHAALWMGLSFFGVAGLFLMLSADFVAAAQVLVYVGAITVLLIFGIMLSDTSDVRSEDGATRRQNPLRSKHPVRRGVLPILSAGGFALLMLVIYSRAGWRFSPPPEVLTDTPRAIGNLLFGQYVIPFEVASLVLLVGLVGAIVLATREEG